MDLFHLFFHHWIHSTSIGSGYQVPSSDEGDTEDHSKLQSGTEGSTKGKKNQNSKHQVNLLPR